MINSIIQENTMEKYDDKQYNTRKIQWKSMMINSIIQENQA